LAQVKQVRFHLAEIMRHHKAKRLNKEVSTIVGLSGQLWGKGASPLIRLRRDCARKYLAAPYNTEVRPPATTSTLLVTKLASLGSETTMPTANSSGKATRPAGVCQQPYTTCSSVSKHCLARCNYPPIRWLEYVVVQESSP